MPAKAFEEGEGVRDVIAVPILAEKEGADGGSRGVAARSGVVFEEVEEGEGSEEKGGAPEGGGEVGEEERGGERYAKGEA